jgi:hypothetical protein
MINIFASNPIRFSNLIRFFVYSFFWVFLFVSFSFSDEWDEYIQGAEVKEKVKVADVKIDVEGNVSKSLIEKYILFKNGDEFSVQSWNSLKTFQIELLNSVLPFYSVSIYELPLDNGDRVVVNLVEGFSYYFDFLPWSVMVSNANVFGNGESLGLWIGLNRQSIDFNSFEFPNIPFGAGLSLGHEIKRDEGEYIVETLHIGGNVNKVIFPFFEVVAKASYTGYLFPSNTFIVSWRSDKSYDYLMNYYGLDTQGIGETRVGLEVSTLYVWRSLNKVAGGVGIGLYHSWFTTLEESTLLKAYLKFRYFPVDFLGFSLYTSLDYWFSQVPHVAMIDNSLFRCPGHLEKSLTKVINRFQLITKPFPKIDLGFTSLEIIPFVYSDQSSSVSQNLIDNIIISYGGGIQIYFASPINIYFSFGYEGRIDSDDKGFLFEANYELY